jgi:ATP-dependent DNA ligase
MTKRKRQDSLSDTMEASFIEPMLLLRKVAIKTGGKVQLRSRNNNDFTTRYGDVAAALGSLPDETVIDGEVVALDEAGRPSWKGWSQRQSLTKEKMKECRWLKPALVAEFEFVEWTPDNHLRHSRFVSLKKDRKPKDVVRGW